MYAIEFNNVWKKFKMGDKAVALRDLIPQMTKKIFKSQNDDLHEKEFWAVKNVNFKVKKGEVLGIIGPNGAGKSTILKLLSKIMKTTKGEFKVNGRLSALIEVTAGFHPDFTGRENVYFNGTIFGMSKKEVDEKFDQIVDFSGVRDFIDTPVKRYSSGMQARLGFAIAAHVNPDVLLVDEVLSVGDKTFQAKCTQKMRELLNSGVTIIFISHNITLVQNLCERVILLNKGEVLHDGKPEEVIPHYENLINQIREDELKRKLSETALQAEKITESIAHIRDVKVLDSELRECESFDTKDAIKLQIDYEAFGEIPRPVFVYEVFRNDGVLAFCSTCVDEGFEIEKISGKGSVLIDLGQTNLSPGVYFCKVSIWDNEQLNPYEIVKKGIIKIDITKSKAYANGIYRVNAKWEHLVHEAKKG